MQYTLRLRNAAASRQWGLTLVELIVTVAILAILASAVVPLARFRAKREKERELRYDLWQMRDAIDRYKDAADRHAFSPRRTAKAIPLISIGWSRVRMPRARSSNFCAASRSIP